MKSLVLLVCALLLLVALSKAQELNCNLQNGAGCDANGPYFHLDYKFTHQGPYSECKQAYNLIVRVPRNSKGFECSFVTDGTPQPNTYRYTISHNPTTYWDPRTPHISVHGGDSLISMAHVPSGIYYNNWWYHPNMHASSGYSWVTYELANNHMYYYSSNTGNQHQSGHPHGFTPVYKTTYIGLNKKYDSNSYAGYGLCQVYCRIIKSSFGQGRAASSATLSGENLSAPSRPSKPPAPPTGSKK